VNSAVLVPPVVLWEQAQQAVDEPVWWHPKRGVGEHSQGTGFGFGRMLVIGLFGSHS
jgi:hypothetical protein